MRISQYLGSVGVLALLLSSSVSFGQTVPATAVPFITEVTPPSLAPGTTPSNQSSFTLTILGANFTPNTVVNLAVSPTYIVHPSATTVNASGSKITAQFAYVVLGSPATFTVTVTNPSGTHPSTSNPYYLPYTPAETSVVLNQNTTSFLAGRPTAMVAGDFFGNGFPGLAVVSQSSNTVSILASNLSGPFTLSSSNPTGNQPWGIVAADFLGTGQPDLAITNSADNTVTILLANGGGTYRLGSTISLPGVFPTQIVAADFNGDGIMDLAVLNTCGTGPSVCFPQAAPQGPGTVTILLGNGDGTFTVSPAALSAGNVPWAMAAADLNGDGFIDLVVANQTSKNLTIFMGNGDGTFTAANASPATGNWPSAIAIGDFNGDGNLDLAVTNQNDNTVSILLNQNCASFPPMLCAFAPAAVSPAVGGGPLAISTADMNADGFLDLVVADSSGNSVSVLLGDGTGAFSAVVPQGQPDFSTGPAPQAVVLADFNQDGRLDIVTGNASGSFTYLRQAAVAQLSLTTSNPATFYGQFVAFTANLIPPIGQLTPTGTITFFDGATSIGTVSLNGYQAYFQYPGLNAGSHQVTAVYNGDSNFLSVTSNAVSETVTQAQTTITLTSDVNTVTYVQPFTLTATILPQNTGNATGTVSFFDTSSSTILGSAAVSNNVAQLTLSKLAAGAHVIVASYQGDANFTGSSSPTYTENVIQASTTVSVASSPNPITLGQTATLTATIQPGTGNTATGAVIFMDNSNPLGFATVSNNSAQLTVSTLTVGTHAITAQYTGDNNFSGSTSTAIPETVNPGSVSITVSSSSNPSTYSQAVTFTASVQPILVTTTPTGTVTFMNGTTNLGIVPLSNGAAQFTATLQYAGLNTITAKYSGDANFQAGQPFSFNQNVSLASTSTTVTSGQNPVAFGLSVTLTAAVQPAFGGSATGSVTFYDGATSLGSVTPTNNVALLAVTNLSVGSHSITASYAGDVNTNASVSAAVTQSVTPAPTTTTMTSSLNPSSYGQAVTFVAAWTPTAAGLGGGTISIYEDGTPVYSVAIAAGPPQVTLYNMTAGTHTLTAQFTPLSSNYAASTSAPLAQTVNPAASLITVLSNPNPSTYAQSVTLQASISTTGKFSSTNTGTLTFLDNGASIGAVTLPGNTNYATLPTTTLNPGAHSITVSYSGDANFLAGTSAVSTQTVNLEPTTTLIASSTYTPAFAQSITLTATVKPSSGTTATGTITFLDRTTTIGTATLSGNTAQFAISTLASGTHYISAQYSGDTNTSSSTSGQTLVTVSPPATTTVLSSSQNPSSLNQPVTFTATLQLTSSGTPTGTVTFYDGSFSLGTGTIANGSAQFTDPGFQIGTHSITAAYSGDANFSGSTSAALSQVVNPGPTTTTVTSSSNPSIVGYNVTFTVNVYPPYGGAPTGLVTLFDGSTSLGSVTLTNQYGQNYALYTLSTLTTGSHAMTAKYNGSAYFAGSTSAVLTQTVNLPATSTYLSSNVNPAVYGQALSLVATVQPPGSGSATGTVTFFDGSTPLGTANVSNNLAQLSVPTLSLGSHMLTAQYSGDTKFAGSTSAPVTETINAATTTTTVSPNISPSNLGQTVVITAVVVPSGGGTVTGSVTFLDGTTSLGTVALSSNVAQLSLSSLSVGSHSITAKYSGDGNFTASTSTAVTQTVNQGTTTIAVASNLNPSTFGQFAVFTATVQASTGGTATGTITFLDGATSLGTATLSSNAAQLSLTNLSTGSHSITAKYSGDSNFTGSTSSSVTQTVNQASTAIAVASNLNPAAFGQAVVFTATVQSSGSGNATGAVTFLDGGTSLGTVTVSSNTAQLSPSSLSVGSHPITAKYSGDTNFTASTSAAVTQTVTQATTTTTVASSLNPATFGQSVTFTVTVQPSAGGTPTGTVTLVDGGTNALANSTLAAGGTTQFTVGGLSAGSHSMTVVYAGDANFSASTSPALVETVNAASTTTVLSSSANPSAFDQSVTFTATVQPVGGTTATGAVTFMDGPTSLGSATLSSNSGQLVISALTVGTHSITAVYAGTTNLSGSTSAALSQVVNGASTTTAVSSSANPSTFGQGVTLSATIQTAFGGYATGTITFLDGTTSLGTATVSSNAAQLSLSSLSVGSHSITAKYSGDGNFTASTSASLTQTINQATSATTVASNLNPATFSQSVVFTATVQPSAGGAPTGTVTLLDGTTSLGSSSLSSGGNAQFTVGGLFAGTHSVTAVYGGDANFTASTSAALVETVSQGSTSTAISSSANPSAFDQTVTFTATVQPPAGTIATGTMTFMDGSTSLGSATLSSNSAQLTVSALTVGTHSVTAAYAGSANLSGSTSAALSQVVNGASTTAAVSSSANPSTFGQGVTLSATIQTAFGGSATGTITFLDGTTSLGTASVSSNGAQLSLSSLSAGSHSITAKYNGDANFSASTSAAIAQTVSQASTTTAVASSLNPSTFGQTVTLTASVQSSSSGTPTGNVTFFDGATSLGSANLSGSWAQLILASLSLGSHSITAKYNGDSNYTASTSAAVTQSVSQSGSSTALASNANPSSFGQAVTFTATVQPSYSGTPSGNVTFFDGGNSLGSISLSGGSAQLTLANFSLGSHSITAQYSGDSNFTASTSAPVAQSVNQAATSTAVSSNANPSVYGQVVTFTATVAPAYSGTPTGNVTFFDGNTSLGNANLSGGVATFSTQSTALIAGSHSITAKYNGDSHFLSSTAAEFAQTVGAAATVTMLASNSDPSPIGQSVNFTAHVSAEVSGNLTGTVNFYLDGGTAPVASVALSGGNAQYTTSSLSGGPHSITAAFVSTNPNFNGSASSSLTQTITDFTFSASPASDTIVRGSTGTYTLTVTPVGGLTGNVSLNCNGAPGGTNCSISPGQVTLNGVNSAQASVTVAVDKHATVGTYTLTLKGTSGSITHSTTVTLTIN